MVKRSVSMLDKLIFVNAVVIFIANIIAFRQQDKRIWMFIIFLWTIHLALYFLVIMRSYGKKVGSRF